MAIKPTTKPGQGILLPERKKTEAAPDYRGDVCLDRDYKEGEAVKLVGWMKTSNAGNPFVNLRVDSFVPDPNWKKPEQPEKAEDRGAVGGARKPFNFPDDEIPF